MTTTQHSGSALTQSPLDRLSIQSFSLFYRVSCLEQAQRLRGKTTPKSRGGSFAPRVVFDPSAPDEDEDLGIGLDHIANPAAWKKDTSGYQRGYLQGKIQRLQSRLRGVKKTSPDYTKLSRELGAAQADLSRLGKGVVA